MTAWVDKYNQDYEKYINTLKSASIDPEIFEHEG